MPGYHEQMAADIRSALPLRAEAYEEDCAPAYPAGQLSKNLYFLNEAINSLENQLLQLHDRLEPVLRPNVPTQMDKASPEDMTLQSPLSRSVEEATDRIRSLMLVVVMMIDHVEV